VFDTESLTLHDDYSVWYYDFGIACSFEIPTKEVKDHLPGPLRPFEVRPGVSVLSLNAVNFRAGNYNFPEEFQEVTIAINVVADLFMAGTVPRYAIYPLNLGASTAGFFSDSYNTDKLPFYQQPLDIRFDREAIHAQCYDQSGELIFEIKNIHPSPKYDMAEEFFQVFAQYDGDFYHGAVTLESERYEHQKKLGSAGTLRPHAIFKGLNVGAIDTKNSYIQIFSPPHTDGKQVYYRLQPM
jgi:hypothetical protein